jgi:hypothetical protein
MTETRNYLRLDVHHPRLTSADLMNLLGATDVDRGDCGEPFGPLRTRQSTYLGVRCYLDGSTTMDDALATAVARFPRLKDVIEAEVDLRVTCILSLRTTPAEWPVLVFDHAFVKRLADINSDLDIDPELAFSRLA